LDEDTTLENGIDLKEYINDIEMPVSE